MDCKMAQSMVSAYINKKLNDHEVEEFIEHIEQCQECHEELEIYFTIHFALQKLDEERDVSYNIKKMLEDNLEATKRHLRRRQMLRVCCYSAMLAAELFLAVVLFTQIEIWNSKDVKNTSVYHLFYDEESSFPQSFRLYERGKGSVEYHRETEALSVHQVEESIKAESESDKIEDGEKNEQKNNSN